MWDRIKFLFSRLGERLREDLNESRESWVGSDSEESESDYDLEKSIFGSGDVTNDPFSFEESEQSSLRSSHTIPEQSLRDGVRLSTEEIYHLLDRVFLQPNIFCDWQYDKKKDKIVIFFNREAPTIVLTNRGVFNSEGENLLSNDLSKVLTELCYVQDVKHHKAIILIIGLYVKLGYIRDGE